MIDRVARLCCFLNADNNIQRAIKTLWLVGIACSLQYHLVNPWYQHEDCLNGVADFRFLNVVFNFVYFKMLSARLV